MSDTDLVERLERLERDNWRLWFVAVCALALVAAAVGFGAVYAAPAIPQKIAAHEFDVVDGSGKVRIKLYVDKGGSPYVSVLDTAGAPQATVSYNLVVGPAIDLGFHRVTQASPGVPRGLMTPDIAIGDSLLGPMITLSPPGTMLGPSVGIGVTKGQPNVTLLDSKARQRAALSLFPGGEPRLEFSGAAGRDTVRLLSLSNGASLEFIGSQNEKTGKYSFPVDRMQLSTWGLYFDDKGGNTAIQLGGVIPGKADSPVPQLMLQGASPLISLLDSQGFHMDLGATETVTEQTGQTQNTSADSIVMFGNDQKGHVIWQAP
jgi:hypothetical protein